MFGEVKQFGSGKNGLQGITKRAENIQLCMTDWRRIGRALTSCVVLMFGLSASIYAQSPAATTHGIGSGYEISGTFTHVLTDGTFGRPLAMNGGTASISGSVLPAVQLTAEVGGYRKPGLTMYSFMAGPQIKVPVWRTQPFVRGLFGLSRISGANEFSVAAGGGIDVPITARIGVRALQCDYYRFIGGTFPKTDLLRVGIGITYSFAR